MHMAVYEAWHQRLAARVDYIAGQGESGFVDMVLYRQYPVGGDEYVLASQG